MSASRWPSWSPKALNAAKDAAEQIFVDYEELPAVGHDRRGRGAGRAAGVARGAKGNIALDWEQGDEAATDAAFAKAAHHPARRDQQPRRRQLDGAARGARQLRRGDRPIRALRHQPGLAPGVGHDLQAGAEDPSGAASGRSRPDVGGGFGLKMSTFAEYPLTLIASEKFGRAGQMDVGAHRGVPVGQPRPRPPKSHAEMAFDADGRILGLQGRDRG